MSRAPKICRVSKVHLPPSRNFFRLCSDCFELFFVKEVWKMSCFCEVGYKIIYDKSFLFAKWEFQLCEVCTGLTQGCCSSTHEKRLLSDIFRLMISQKVWNYLYFELIGQQKSIYKLFRSSWNAPECFNFARAYRQCSVLSHAKFWFGPNFFMFPRRKKNENTKKWVNLVVSFVTF